MADLLCPALLLVILFDSLSFTGWSSYYGRDVELYSAIARFWEQGAIPYRDVFDFKPPLIYVLQRVGFVIWGYEAESLRRVLVCVSVLAGLIVYLGLRSGRRYLAAPVVSLGLVTSLVALPGDGFYQNTEPFAAAFAAMAMGLAAAGASRPGPLWAMASGFALGLAVLCKQPAVLFALPILAQLVLWPPPPGTSPYGRLLLQSVLGLGAGMYLAVAPMIVYFAYQDAVPELYQAVVASGFRYSHFTVGDLLSPGRWLDLLGRPASGLFFSWLTAIPRQPFWVALAVLPILTALRPGRWLLIVWLWIAAAYAAAVVGPRAEYHYLLITFPALALALGIALEEALPLRLGRRAGPAVGLLVAVAIFAVVWQREYLPARQGPAPQRMHDGKRIGLLVADLAGEGDRLYVGGEPFRIYTFAGLLPASRILYENAPLEDAEDIRQADLMRGPPFVFLPQKEHRAAQKGGSTARLYGQTADFVRARYRICDEADMGVLYIDRDHPNRSRCPTESP